MPSDTLTRLATLPCQGCEGEKQIVQHIGKGFDNEWEERPCPACQEDGQPTGLALPGLSVRCESCRGAGWWRDWWTGDEQPCKRCHGTGRRPKQVTVDLLLEAAAWLGMSPIRIWPPDIMRPWTVMLDDDPSVCSFAGEGDTALEALASALEWALECMG